MNTIQHLNSVIDHYWPEYQRRFPAFEKPQIVPAETLRGMAPTYMRRNIDQDPTSYYIFFRANPMNGDSSRDCIKELVDDLFYNKLRMPSSYEVNDGYSREDAISKEILPAAEDREFQRYYDEQMAVMDAQHAAEERQRRIDNLGFDPDDGNTIDVEIDDDGNAIPVSDTRAVGQAQSTAVGMPKQIWYAVDIHVPAGGMLGYNGRSNRLGRRRSGGYLRENNPEEMMKEFIEGQTDNVEEDDMLKNRPHNLHKDEGLVEAEKFFRGEKKSVDEGENLENEGENLENEGEDEFSLNESLIRFCDRLIRG